MNLWAPAWPLVALGIGFGARYALYWRVARDGDAKDLETLSAYERRLVAFERIIRDTEAGRQRRAQVAARPTRPVAR